MLTSNEKELSNLSYTNKDFGTIYPELLDLATKLSYKWDPSQSDESDPGVVLLKLAALMADKNNYNIDKNILELFPLSVTQLPNARQLFDQLGYTMRYYQSATTDIELVLVNPPIPTESDYSDLGVDTILGDKTEEEIEKYWEDTEMIYTLPRFTMISDPDNTIVYTITDEITLSTNGITEKVSAIQGTANQYLINGEKLITPANLDYNNRLYFTETDIAENGIFITTGQYDDWKRVDNLLIQEIGTPCYKFGITEDGSKCYLEFPTDIDTLMGSGLNITYIRTSGLEGNIAKTKLNQFHVDTKGKRYIPSISGDKKQECTLTSENVFIKNPLAAVNGKNPETIDEAYKSYQKVKNTFGTLVSLKDYSDFMITNENVSNGYVCDRTNDVQSSYKILNSSATTSNNTVTVITKDSESHKPNMLAYDLKTYALAYVDTVSNAVAFNETFRVLTDETSNVNDMYNLLHDTETGWGELKSIQHDFIDIKPYEIMMIKNKYHIDAKIIPQFKVTTLQETDIKNKVHEALYKALNSKEMNYGDPVEYDVIYDTIMNADPRIKALVLQDIIYKTYAVYTDDNKTKNVYELQIDSGSIQPEYSKEENELLDKSKTPHDLWDKFRREIYSKSVLAGKTQFLAKEGEFNHSLQENETQIQKGLYYVDTDTTIKVELDDKGFGTSKELLENENMIFTAVNLIDDVPYTNYCKFIYKFANITDTNKDKIFITKDYDYTMRNKNEYIIFLWKPNDDEGTPYYYRKYVAEDKYAADFKSSKIDTFSTTFSLKGCQPEFTYNYIDNEGKSGERSGIVLSDLNFFNELPPTGSKYKGTITGTINIGSKDDTFILDANTFISKIAGSDYVLSGSNQITTKTINKIHINNKTGNGTDRVYWILNNPTASNTYKLFDATSDIKQSYTLQTGEYLIYGNYAQTQLVMLSSGTKIERENKNGNMGKWEVNVISYDDFISDPYGKLDGYWRLIDEGTDLYATEQQFYQIGAGCKVQLDEVTRANTESQIPKSIQISTQMIKIMFNDEHYSTDEEGVLEEKRREFLCNHKITLIDESNELIPLPYRNKPEYSWLAKSILNLNCSSDKPQTIIANRQTVKFYDNSTVKEENGKPTSELKPLIELPLTSAYFSKQENAAESKLYDTHLVTNREVSLTGGVKIDTTSLDLISGEIIPLNISAFIPTRPTMEMQNAVQDANPTRPIDEVDNNNWKFELDSTGTSVSVKLPSKSSYKSLNIAEYVLPIMLPAGEYIIPLTCTNNLTSQNNLNNFLQVTFHLASDGVVPEGSRDPSDPNKINSAIGPDGDGKYIDARILLTNVLGNSVSYGTIGTHSLKLTLEDPTRTDGLVQGYLTVFFDTTDIESETLITLGTPYHYTYKHDNIAEFSEMLDEINKWNNYKDKALFNYTYQVKKEDLLENPLDSISFVNSSHPYNPYTICQWDITDKENNKIVIENKIK